MQEYLLAELSRLAGRPTTSEWLERARRLATGSGVRLTADQIVAAIKAGRGE